MYLSFCQRCSQHFLTTASQREMVGTTHGFVFFVTDYFQTTLYLKTGYLGVNLKERDDNSNLRCIICPYVQPSMGDCACNCLYSYVHNRHLRVEHMDRLCKTEVGIIIALP